MAIPGSVWIWKHKDVIGSMSLPELVLACVGVLSASIALCSYISNKRKERISVAMDFMKEFEGAGMAHARRFSSVTKELFSSGVLDVVQLQNLIENNTINDESVKKKLANRGLDITSNKINFFGEDVKMLFNFYIRVNVAIDYGIADGNYLVGHLSGIFSDNYEMFYPIFKHLYGMHPGIETFAYKVKCYNLRITRVRRIGNSLWRWWHHS